MYYVTLVSTRVNIAFSCLPIHYFLYSSKTLYNKTPVLLYKMLGQ